MFSDLIVNLTLDLFPSPLVHEFKSLTLILTKLWNDTDSLFLSFAFTSTPQDFLNLFARGI